MRVVEIYACLQCPWIWWEHDKPFCHNPETLDKRILDEGDIPDWCMLDELVAIEDEDE